MPNLLDYIKLARNQVVASTHRRFAAPDNTALKAVIAATKGQNVVVAVAFNQPWVIKLLFTAWQRFASNTILLIVDNSNKLEARREIRSLCYEHGFLYLPLPRNPEWNPNRSHALAMNWVWSNVIRVAQPAYWGFLDHDCLPVAPFDLAETMQNHSLYGFLREARLGFNYWNLWAGFCFYRNSAVEGRSLNFLPRHDIGMDTGGQNYVVLYQHIAQSGVLKASNQMVDVEQNAAKIKLQLIDGRFIHIGGVSYKEQAHSATYKTAVIDYLNTKI